MADDLDIGSDVPEKESTAYIISLVQLSAHGLGESWRRQNLFGYGQVLDGGWQA
jgi:hypothetical protein